MTWDDLCERVGPLGLRPIGGLRPQNDQPARTIVLLAADEPAFWDVFSKSPEYLDERPHPMDRWSTRVISRLAQDLDAQVFFPFGGPPYQPFFSMGTTNGSSASVADPTLGRTAGRVVDRISRGIGI